MASKKRKPKGTGVTKGAGRTRVFATVIYPESLPEDWLERLKKTCLKVLISPLHDKDLNEDGTPKKPHYHVLVMFDNVKSWETQVKPLFDEIFESGYAGRVEVNSTTGYARYLCHLDNPEKYQYDRSEVIALGGAEYTFAINKIEDDVRMRKELIAFVKEKHIAYFNDLYDMASKVNPEWEVYLATKSYFMKEYMKARGAKIRAFYHGQNNEYLNALTCAFDEQEKDTENKNNVDETDKKEDNGDK